MLQAQRQKGNKKKRTDDAVRPFNVERLEVIQVGPNFPWQGMAYDNLATRDNKSHFGLIFQRRTANNMNTCEGSPLHIACCALC